jgi:N-acetylglucosaminyldiphosphoundecaprenol N-acetyl-beta-D-mannosaminyltransferase
MAARIDPFPRRALLEGLARRTLDVAGAAALLALAFPLACVALAPARGRPWPRLGTTVCAGVDARAFLLRHEILGREARGFAWRLARSALADWPVLLAVLRGHMSLVGPRVMRLEEATALAPADRDRFAVRPGLVCHWWVWRRTNIDFGSEAQADLRYLRERSLRGDLAILLRALLALPYGAAAATHRAAETISGIRLLNLGMDELVDAILAALHRRVVTRVAFVNPDCVNIAARNPRYRALLARTEWVCPDGIGMKIAGRVLDRPIRQNLNGTDLFPRLCAALAASGHRLYLLGARPGVAEAVARWAQGRHPGLAVAGWRSGYFQPAQADAVLADIRNSKADVLLVAMGVPLQEAWMRENLGRSGAVVGIGVGGLFDFYGGRIPRAPLWLREIGGEWLYRLLQEPRRMWRRYLLGNVTFLWRIGQERRAQHLAAAGGRR